MAAEPAKDEWTAEDDERVLATIDDGVKASIATMFMGRAQDDVITVDHLTEIMSELQVAYDPEVLSKIVPEAQWDSITLYMTNVLIGRFVEMAQRASAEQAKTDSAVAVAQATSSVVYLDTFAYVTQLMPCSNDEEGVQYRWNRPKLDVRPKTTLMASVAVMMLVVTVALVIVVVVLNADLMRRQLQQSEEQLARAVDAALGHHVTSGARSVLAGSATRAAAVFAGVIDALQVTYTELRGAELSTALTTVSAIMELEAMAMYNDTMKILAERAGTVELVFRTVGTTLSLTTLLDGWARDAANPLAAIAVQDGATLVYASMADSCGASPIASTACHVNNTGMPRVGVETACNVTYAFAAVYLSRIRTSICVMRPHGEVVAAVKTHLDGAITHASLSDVTATIELQGAVQLDGSATFEVIGSRRHLPALCVRGGTCPELSDGPFRRAVATPVGTVGVARIRGYRGKEMVAATTHVVIPGATIALLLTTDMQHIRRSFEEAAGAGVLALERNASVDLHLVLAVFDELNRVVVLPAGASNASAAEEAYLTYALNGRSGSVVPTTTSPLDVLAGYALANASAISVGVQMSNTGVGLAAVRFATDIVDDANARFVEGWELAVYVERTPGTIERTTARRRETACLQNGCDAVPPAVREALATRGTGFLDTTDYAGVKVMAWYRYLRGPPPTVLIAEISREKWLDEPLRRERLQAIIVGLAVVIAVEAIIFVLTRRIMDRIEDDYNRYKRQIEDEKAQFSDLVKDVMPPYIAERIMKGTRLIAETHPQLTFFFSDIVGSTETSKTMTNKQLVRMLGYTFMLEDEIASYFGVHKIKTIGDAYFAVAGLEDSASGGATGTEHQVYRMTSFACVMQQLIGPGYTHYPERTECFRISAGGSDLGPMRMVRMRMGIHTGPAVAGVVDVGRAPHFDCFGPSVNLASRMESTSTSARVQLSGPTMDILSRLDADHLFEFDAPRRTLVKGYGTMTTYLVKSTNIAIPKTIMEKLQIDHANQRQFFTSDTPGAAPTGSALAGSTPLPTVQVDRQPDEQQAAEPVATLDTTPPPAGARPPLSPPHEKAAAPPPDRAQRPPAAATPVPSSPKRDRKEKTDKKEKRDKSEKKEKRDKKDRAEAVRDSNATRQPAVPPTPQPDEPGVPDALPDFDGGAMPDPPPMFDGGAFEMPPPPPPDF